jgi:DNA-binding NarL/FixJ family response regulator
MFNTGESKKPDLELVCEMPEFASQLGFFVRSLGYTVAPSGTALVLVDARMGSALLYLEKHDIQKPTLVLSDNACCVYQQMLQNYQPNGYLTKSQPAQIAQAIIEILQGKIICNLPPSKVLFTPRELTIARHLARGKTDKEIACLLSDLKESSVSKYVNDVLEKARLAHQTRHIANRTQFALWFWGQDHILDEWV